MTVKAKSLVIKILGVRNDDDYYYKPHKLLLCLVGEIGKMAAVSEKC